MSSVAGDSQISFEIVSETPNSCDVAGREL